MEQVMRKLLVVLAIPVLFMSGPAFAQSLAAPGGSQKSVFCDVCKIQGCDCDGSQCTNCGGNLTTKSGGTRTMSDADATRQACMKVEGEYSRGTCSYQ